MPADLHHCQPMAGHVKPTASWLLCPYLCLEGKGIPAALPAAGRDGTVMNRDAMLTVAVECQTD